MQAPAEVGVLHISKLHWIRFPIRPQRQLGSVDTGAKTTSQQSQCEGLGHHYFSTESKTSRHVVHEPNSPVHNIKP